MLDNSNVPVILPESNDWEVTLSDEQVVRVDKVVDKLFSLSVDSPDFYTLADSFHQRDLKGHIDKKVGKGFNTNVQVAVGYMLELQNVLDWLLPDQKPAGWEFKKSLSETQREIERLIDSLSFGLRCLEADLEFINSEFEVSLKSLSKLYKVFALNTEMRAKILSRLSSSPERVQQAFSETVVFYLNQRQIDIATEVAVLIQSRLANQIVRSTNISLKMSVNRILTTTVRAVRNMANLANHSDSAKVQEWFRTGRNQLGFDGKAILETVAEIKRVREDLSGTILNVSELQKSLFCDVNNAAVELEKKRKAIEAQTLNTKLVEIKPIYNSQGINPVYTSYTTFCHDPKNYDPHYEVPSKAVDHDTPVYPVGEDIVFESIRADDFGWGSRNWMGDDDPDWF